MRVAVHAAVALAAAIWACGAPAQKPAAEPAASTGSEPALISSKGQAFPARPVRFVCPFVAGGAGDIFSRTIAQRLTEALGQPVVVDNRPGANGGIGTELVARATPDGYTLLMGSSGPLAVNPVLNNKLPYDPIRDFAPITQGTSYMYVLVVPAALPVTGLAEFTALLKAKPGQMTFGSPGVGGGSHLSGELFNVMTGTRTIHVPYTGSTAALAALLSGQVNYMFDIVITSVPHLRAGRLRGIGVTALRRASVLPEVPTLDELGLTGFELTQWQGVVAPAGTPKPVVDLLYREVARALKLPDVVERLATQGGNQLIGNTPEEFAQIIKNDLAKYAKLVKSAKIQVQ